ncbi:UvrD-helicase domain-containing protein [Paenibacillus senegalensis]|uniref:UvrD-helicase domain-containing protein n=1 Tax=Paenibacillus senegalensis TaxID=1465766 RepID=UPI000288FD4A|nr:UvrD-helicase domain-containing protein [Paenibacillus senegalensis]
MQFFKTPFGAGIQTIPKAQIAMPKTSKVVVTDSESDAFFFRSLEQQGIHLNEPQVQAVRHFNGPLLTLAGAGTGKTSVLVCRTGYLISVHTIKPEHILLVTFSRKAAEEMRERIARLPGMNKKMTEQIQARTFHSFFLLVIRKYGVTQDILGESRVQQIILKRILRSMNLQDKYQPENLLSLLSSYKMQMVEVRCLPDKSQEDQELKKIFIAYEDWKRDNEKIDFDDVLLMAYILLLQKPKLLAALQNRFQYVMIDEFQDTNSVQYELIKMIVQPHQNLMVVGDDDQTIYSFNGARNDFILNFDQLYPTAKTITLDINYRSVRSVVGLGNEIIRHNRHRREKTLKATHTGGTLPRYLRPKDADDEAEMITDFVIRKLERGEQEYKDFAVLFRSASNSRAIIEQFVMQDIPFIDYSNEETFYDHWLVKPLLDHLRISLNPKNMDAIEGMLPTLYVSRDQGMQHILDQEAGQKKKWPLIHLKTYPDYKDFQKQKLVERLKLIKSMQAMKPAAAIEAMREDFYEQYLETNKRSKMSNYKENLLDTLDELESSAQRFSTVEEFIAFIDDFVKKRKEMVRRRSNSGNDNKVSLMTIHKSKGLEFPTVFLIGASEDNMPHHSIFDAKQMNDVFRSLNGRDKVNAALEEERRLAYVAVTRAKEHLIISSPSYHRGKKQDVSRFILDAFPKQKQPATNQAGRKQHQPTTRKIKETVYAWICTADRCGAWQRITTYEEGELLSKDCPMCKSPMEKGSKEVSSTS